MAKSAKKAKRKKLIAIRWGVIAKPRDGAEGEELLAVRRTRTHVRSLAKVSTRKTRVARVQIKEL